MNGETNLRTMLDSLAPTLRSGEFVFCTIEHARYGERPELAPIAAVVETEGLTLVIPRANADAHAIDYESVFKCITLNVHSSLDAVGLTAAFATRLTERGISANVFAGYYHDHIFVQAELAQRALDAIRDLAE